MSSRGMTQAQVEARRRELERQQEEAMRQAVANAEQLHAGLQGEQEQYQKAMAAAVKAARKVNDQQSARCEQQAKAEKEQLMQSHASSMASLRSGQQKDAAALVLPSQFEADDMPEFAAH